MHNEIKINRKRKHKRALRVRKKVRGSSSKPRLSVVKSNKHLYAQLIDDINGKTLGSVSTLSKEVKNTDAKKNKETAKKLGELIAAIAKDKNINEVVFDRGPFKYHGILAELANAARENGLAF